MSGLVIDRTTLRLPPEQYYAERCTKAQIVIHHTVGGSARSTYNWWLMDRTKSGGELRVGTAYIIERDGRIYETFDPEHWAHHLGLNHRDNTALNKASIGIELASEGPLAKQLDGSYRTTQGAPYRGPEPVELDEPFRGWRHFDAYDPPQLAATIALVVDLVQRFQIVPECIAPADEGKFHEKFYRFAGVIGHCNVRADKSDPHPGFPWAKVRASLAAIA